MSETQEPIPAAAQEASLDVVAAEFSAAELGRRVAIMRHERELTIVQLATAAGISSGLVSQIERGNGNPAYHTLMKLAHALGAPVTSFFPDSLDSADRLIVRRNERRRLTAPSDNDVEVDIMTPSLHGNLLIGWVEIPVGVELAETTLNAVAERAESLVVVSGVLVVTTRGEEHRLYEGDSITFDPYRVRTLASGGSAPTVFMQVVIRTRSQG